MAGMGHMLGYACQFQKSTALFQKTCAHSIELELRLAGQWSGALRVAHHTQCSGHCIAAIPGRLDHAPIALSMRYDSHALREASRPAADRQISAQARAARGWARAGRTMSVWLVSR